jgi:DNA repair photolyase
MDEAIPNKPIKGRGAVGNPAGRFEASVRYRIDDGWNLEEDAPRLPTVVTPDNGRSLISYNDSPDTPFDRTINPYRGCEHGCVYCFARPSHAWLGLSPGLDFESRLFVKENAPALLDAELRRPGYRCRPILIGGNTDPYQPLERERGLTRRLVETLLVFNHPFAIATKSRLVLRDRDLLAEAARRGLAVVGVSLTTLQRDLARRLEPRAAAPARRLEAIAALSAAGVPVSVLVAPVIPALTDHETERILAAARAAGARSADYVLLRLPHELKDVFSDWLAAHYPERARRVLNLLRESRRGGLYVSEFGERMRGSGERAALIERRFAVACRRLGLRRHGSREAALDATQFSPPPRAGDQLPLL